MSLKPCFAERKTGNNTSTTYKVEWGAKEEAARGIANVDTKEINFPDGTPGDSIAMVDAGGLQVEIAQGYKGTG